MVFISHGIKKQELEEHSPISLDETEWCALQMSGQAGGVGEKLELSIFKKESSVV